MEQACDNNERPGVALLYAGFFPRYNRLMAESGFAESAERIRELWTRGEHDAAIRAVPDALIDTTGIKLSPLELLEKLAAIVPLPRAHLVRYGGCLAPHSKLRHMIMPTPRQKGMDDDKLKTGTPYWHWARLLGRVFRLDMMTCPFCQQGSLRLIAAIPHESVITRILRHLKLSSVPPPMAPARCRQEVFAFD
jgi:hypothetical protein